MPLEPLYGLMAEFDDAEHILVATRQARLAGYREMEAYTPYPVDGLAEEMGFHVTRITFLVFVAGLFGAGAGFFMQWYSMTVNYPFDSGGRPPNSWPAFIPVTFEVMVLVAAFAGLF